MSPIKPKENTPRTVAFVRTTKAYHRRLYGLAISLCKDSDRAWDLTQDTLLKAFEAFDTFHQGAPVFPWLARILRNTFLDTFKTGRALYERAENELSPTHYPISIETADLGADPFTRVEHAQLQQLLHEGIGRLSAPLQMIATLCDINGLTYKEAAEVADIPVGTVRSRLAAARLQLREWMLKKMSVLNPQCQSQQDPPFSSEPMQQLTRTLRKDGSPLSKAEENSTAKLEEEEKTA